MDSSSPACQYHSRMTADPKGEASVSIVFSINAGLNHGGPGRRTRCRSRSARWFTVAAAWLGTAVLALAGCSSGSSTGSLSDYNVVCNGTAVPGAAAYQGAGPHPIAFFLDGSSGGDGTIDSIDADYDTPDSWSPSAASLVQLVACINITNSSRTKDCGAYSVVPGSSEDTDVTLQWQNYTISLYQAKTGTLVTKPILLVGETGATCPYSVDDSTPSSNTYTVYTSLASTQVQQALTKYVS